MNNYIIFKINQLQVNQTIQTNNVPPLVVSAGNSPKSELEQVKRDKSIATGLINTMQKDLTTKVFIQIYFPLIKNQMLNSDYRTQQLLNWLEKLKA